MSTKALSAIAVLTVAALLVSAVPATAELIDVSNSLNVLSSTNTATASSVLVESAAATLDGYAAGGEDSSRLIFYHHDDHQLLAITGFDSDFHTVRIFSICNTLDSGNSPCRNLVDVTIRSSTTDRGTSLDPSDYETVLATDFQLCGVDCTTVKGTIYWGEHNPENGDAFVYFDVPVSAPEGTKSMLLDFGAAVDSTSWDLGHGDRVFEVQALRIPEPGTLALLATGLIGLLAYAWRKRK